MTPIAVIATCAAYFAVMLFLGWISSRGTDNQGFFNGGRKAPWWIVAIAMIGMPMSGVTYVSVPGMVGVGGTAMGYMQMVLGFFVGYLVIAFVLTPVFFKMNMASIYQYLDNRFGVSSHKTGAWFFFISKILGAAVRLYLVCVTLQLMVFTPLRLPFILNVVISMAIVLLYTFRGGVKSVIWNDTLKTVCMVVSIILAMVFIAKDLGLDFKGMVATIKGSEYSRIFFFDDVNHKEYFWKQFLAGVFTVIAMTGLDQDMMQRTMASRNAKDSRKNLITSGLMQIPVIFMFLCLGVLLYVFAAQRGIAETGDTLFPAVATGAGLPMIVGVLFQELSRHGRADGSGDNRLLPSEHHFRDRRGLQAGELHLRADTRDVRFRDIHETSGPRQVGAACGRPGAGSLLHIAKQLGTLVRGI